MLNRYLPQLPHVTWDGKAHTIDAEIQIDKMVAAYLEAAVFFDKPEEEDWSDCEFAREAEANAEFECIAFLKLARWHVKDWTMEQLGHDFWLTRNHHGAGFWDRDFGDEHSRKRLTELSHIFGETDVYKGDDGLLYI